MEFKHRAIIGLALASLLFGNIQVRECRTKDPIGQRDSPWTSGRSDLKLDAFDMELCGNARFQDWQEDQGAFGFKWSEPATSLVGASDNRIDGSFRPRIANGRDASVDEFPWFAKLNMTVGPNRTVSCGGTLVHNNLVITAAHCVADGRDMIVSAIKLYFGTNERNPSDDAVSELADKWCWLKNHNDLAVIRLGNPVEYENGKITPACLWPKESHAGESKCTLPGMGFSGPDQEDRKKPLPDVLQAKNFSRVACDAQLDPSLSCYLPEEVGDSCEGDSGSGLVCYDRSYNDQEMVKAFAVGALSYGEDRRNQCVLDKRLESYMVDFHKLEEDLAGLLYEVQREHGADEERFTCKKPKGRVALDA